MANGIQILSADGSLQVDYTDHLSRIVYQRHVALNETGQITLSLPSGHVVPVSISMGNYQAYLTAHAVSLDPVTGLFRWYKNTAESGDFGPSLVMVIAYG